MTVTHYLITDATAAEVEAKIGLQGHPTPLGVLVKAPKPFEMYEAMAIINRALEPPNPCICGRFAVLHRPNCPMALAVT